jgi:hypothetical protein
MGSSVALGKLEGAQSREHSFPSSLDTSSKADFASSHLEHCTFIEFQHNPINY